MNQIRTLMPRPAKSAVRTVVNTVLDINHRLRATRDVFDIESPVMVLARGHSGTRFVAQVLNHAGVYVGDYDNRSNLNYTWDSVPWTYDFQRLLVPQLWEYGHGIRLQKQHEELVKAMAWTALGKHLSAYRGGRWGFKTCATQFSVPLYDIVFPKAKYIYIVRDGRDVILSSNVRFHLADPVERRQYWDYFKIITYGLSDDIASSPFVLPDVAPEHEDNPVTQNAYWIQAKSWREHVKMVEHLKSTGLLHDGNMLTIRYEDMITNPAGTVKTVFDFLNIELTLRTREFTRQNAYVRSLERWRNYEKYIDPEILRADMPAIFETMAPELAIYDYPAN